MLLGKSHLPLNQFHGSCMGHVPQSITYTLAVDWHCNMYSVLRQIVFSKFVLILAVILYMPFHVKNTQQ